MNQGKGRKKYVCGIAGILIVSLIAFYVVLNGTENNQTSQVKNEIYTLEREGFEMTEEEAAKAVFDYMYSDCDYDYEAKVISTTQQGEMVYLYQTQEKSDLQYEMLQSKIGQKMGNIMSLHTIHVMKQMPFRRASMMNITRITQLMGRQAKFFGSLNG